MSMKRLAGWRLRRRPANNLTTTFRQRIAAQPWRNSPGCGMLTGHAGQFHAPAFPHKPGSSGKQPNSDSREDDMAKLNINGSVRDVEVEPDTPLLWVIRE